IEAEQVNLKFLSENDPEQKAAKLNTLAQAHSTLEQLRSNPPIGRVGIHIQDAIEKWQNTPADVVLRAGDTLGAPKKAGYILVDGQVCKPTAAGYRPGRSANLHLRHPGRPTQLDDKQATFGVRGDGYVISPKNNAGSWPGDLLNAVLRPGDTVLV